MTDEPWRYRPETLTPDDLAQVREAARASRSTPDARGLHNKFSVYRRDGRDGPGGKHDGCLYFVLDLTHDEAAQSILPALADAYEKHGRPQLAADLRALASPTGDTT